MTSGSFTASEAARLVCGYLQTTGCDETKEKFLEESAPDLKLRDFANLVDQGILRTFDVDGRSLLDILNEYAAMKSTLEGLMKSALPPDETVMYKSDGPLRKLKVLSDHWMSSKARITTNNAQADCDLDNIQHSPPATFSRVRRPTNKVMPCTRKDLKVSLGLNHSYNTERPERSTADLLPIKRSNGRRLRYENGSSQATRSRILAAKKDQVKPPSPEEIKATEQEVDRMLNPPSSSSASSSEAAVFKSPSPMKTLLSTPTKSAEVNNGLNSPLKSRKSQLKSKVPTKRKPVETENSLSMPSLSIIQDGLDMNKVKEALVLSDEQKLKSIAEPIANVANSNVSTKELENFMANDELLNNLLNLVDEVSNIEHDKASKNNDPDNNLEKPPPSNSSSTCTRLAIDDQDEQAMETEDDVPNLDTDLSSPIVQHTPDPPPPPPEEEEHSSPIEADKSAESTKEPEKTPTKESTVEECNTVSNVTATITKEVVEEMVKFQGAVSEEEAENTDLDSIKKTLSLRGTDVVSPDKPGLVSQGFMENLQAEHEKVETIGFIEASALKNLVEQQPEEPLASNTNQVATAVTTCQPQQHTNLRRSSRQRKKPKHQEEEQLLVSTKKRPKEDKVVAAATIKPLVSNHHSRLMPTINSLVSTDTRNLQLVTPMMQDSLSVSEYLKHCLEASIVTSNAIDEASASGLDLDQVSLDNTELLNSLFKSGNTAFSFDENRHDPKSDNLRDHIIEDSIERDIRTADETTAELIRAAQTATTADNEVNAALIMMQPATADTKRKIEFDSNALITAAQNSTLVTKTPKKIGNYEESNSNTTFSSLFKTPKKTPIKSLKDHMSEDSIDKALSGLFKTPVKGLEQVANAAAESLLRRTPARKSPMPSPFLGSPKTPTIDVSIQSISFNQDEIHVTPSVQAQGEQDKCLSLEISPSLSLNTPSPVATQASPSESDGPLITPPLDMAAPITPAKYSLHGSMGAPRTPCRTPLSRAVDELVMNSPLKALSDAAKRLFNEEGGQNKTFVFLSPSKRAPKRASLVQVDSRSPMRGSAAFHSTWEARHDVNNLDHYQNIVKESEPTPNPSRKRRISNPQQKPSKKSKVTAENDTKKTPGKTGAKVTFQEDSSPRTPGKSLKLKSPLATSGIDINMELVPQLRTTPRKFGENVRRNSVAENVPKALGLVPKTPEQLPKTPKTPKTVTPPITVGTKKSRKNKSSVQRNLLDEDGFVSPRKTRVTPIKVSKKVVQQVKAASPIPPSSIASGRQRIAASPAKVAIAFMSPRKLPSSMAIKSTQLPTLPNTTTGLPQPVAKNPVTTMKASLLSLSDPFNFFQQSPWDSQ